MGITEISVLIRLITGALMTFCAILLWSRTRNMAWILLIIGIIVMYVEIVFSTLEKFGILKNEFFTLFGAYGISIVQIILVNLPYVFFSLAFIAEVARRKY